MKTIDKDVYDALEMSAEAYGGIGAFSLNRDDAPCCLLGHIDAVAGEDYEARDRIETAVQGRAGNIAGPNDNAVTKINYRRGRGYSGDRVPFADYVKERGWVRGA